MRSRLPALVVVACVAVVSGCGRSEPTFSSRQGLAPAMDEYVRTSIDQKFGIPNDIRVWDRLPLRPHAATAVVGEGAQDKILPLTLVEQHRDLVNGQEVVWVAGTSMPQDSAKVKAESWNAEANLLKLSAAPPAPPKTGDRVVVGPGAVLVHGRALYAEHCQHCHGVGGDGKGPTAPYLNIRPRDYRKGLFKFTSTKEGLKAHRDDLGRIVEEGIPGTYMPSFKLLKKNESQAIIEYVLYLSMRGETEYALYNILAGDYSNDSIATRVKDGETEDKIVSEFVTRVKEGEIDDDASSMLEKMIGDWTTAQTPEAIIVPKEKRYASDAASIERGRALYLSNNLNCVACHGDSGLGDGIQTYSITVNTETQKPNLEPGLYDTWGNKIKPRNLRLGMFRGGRRPIDVYARIEAGIKGTPMPAFGGKMTEQQKWDLVNYILELPHEARTPGTGVAPVTANAAPAAPAAAH